MTSMTCRPTYRRENLVRPYFRHCVRGVRLSRRFPLAGPLSSALSAGAGVARHRSRLAPWPLFEGFAGTMGPSDFPRSYIIGVRPKTSRCGLPRCRGRTSAGHPGSRARCFRACAGSLTARGSGASGDRRRVGCGLPLPPTASAPRSKFLSRLNTRPARTPVNTSPTPLRTAAHDLGPLWTASPSTYDSFIHYTLPVYPGAQETKRWAHSDRASWDVC